MNRPLRFFAVLGLAAVLIAPALAYAQDSTGDATAGMSKAQKYYLHGVELMNNLKYLDAVEQFQLAIDENPKYVDAFRRLALAYTEMAKSDADYYQDALDTYQQLQKLLPDTDVGVRKNIAYVQAAMGDLDDAISTYQQILTVTPQDCSAWDAIGGAQRQMALKIKEAKGDSAPEYKARLDQSVQAFQKEAEVCPDSLGAYNALGELYFNAGENQKAAAVYAKLFEKNPNDVNVASRLAYLYVQDENWAKAAEAYKQLLALDSTRVNDRAIYAKALQKLGRTQEAVDQYMRLISDDPSKATLYCNIAFIYIDSNQEEKAIETAMKGIGENAPVQPCLYAAWGKGLELRATAQLAKYDYDRAVSTYGEAKIKFQSPVVMGDANFGKYAKNELLRLDQLIERAKQMKAKDAQANH